MTTNKARLIKRYQNRKLYDTVDSCYVTLDDISELIKQGEDLQVIDNTTREDLTSVTLAQIIFEAEKRQENVLPLSAFFNIVRSSGDAIRGFVQKSIESSVREVGHVSDEVGDFVGRLVKRGHLSQEDSATLRSTLRQFFDHKIRATVEKVQSIPAVQSDLKELQHRIEELEKRLKDYEKK